MSYVELCYLPPVCACRLLHSYLFGPFPWRRRPQIVGRLGLSQDCGFYDGPSHLDWQSLLEFTHVPSGWKEEGINQSLGDNDRGGQRSFEATGLPEMFLFFHIDDWRWWVEESRGWSWKCLYHEKCYKQLKMFLAAHTIYFITMDFASSTCFIMNRCHNQIKIQH